MNNFFYYVIISFFLICNSAYAKQLHPAVTKPIPVNDIKDFDKYPKEVKNLIIEAKKLSTKNLTYIYGSDHPKNQGMDCSGTIKYLLSKNNINPPRQANHQYLWVQKQGKLHKIKSIEQGDKLKDLKPGDLLFWSNTYKVDRTPPITHVMLYLGKNKRNQHLMFGSSNGLSYQKKPMYGVSVFDFNYSKYHPGKFVAYGCIPGVSCVA